MTVSIALWVFLAYTVNAGAQNFIEHVTNGELNIFEDSPSREGPCFSRPYGEGLGHVDPASPDRTYANPLGWSRAVWTPDLFLGCGGQIPTQSASHDEDSFEDRQGNTSRKVVFTLPDKWVETTKQSNEKAAYIGMWGNKTAREYAQNELAVPLVRGRKYRLKMRVAVRHTPYGLMKSTTELLYSPKFISVVLSTYKIDRGRTDVFLTDDKPRHSVFTIEDQSGFGTFGYDNGVWVNGVDRWQEVTHEFTVPDDLAEDVSFVAISPNKPKKNLVEYEDMVRTTRPSSRTITYTYNEKELLTYIYLDGISIQEVCGCNDIQLDVRPIPRGKPDEPCCFDVELSNPGKCSLATLQAQVAGGQWTSVSDLRSFNWAPTSTFKTQICLEAGSWKANEPVPVRIRVVSPDGSGGERINCESAHSLLCECHCDDAKPTINITPSKPLPDDGSECCFDINVDFPQAVPCALNPTASITISSDLGVRLQQFAYQVPAVNGTTVVGRFCLATTSDATQTTAVKVGVSVVNGGVACPPTQFEGDYRCDVMSDECCDYASFSVQPTALQESVRPLCATECSPVDLVLEYNSAEPLCGDKVEITERNGSLVSLVNVPSTGTPGSKVRLATLCPGSMKRSFIVCLSGVMRCIYLVDIPACENPKEKPDEPGVPGVVNLVGKARDVMPDVLDEAGDGPYTLSVIDLRGVLYDTFNGTNIDVLQETAKERSTAHAGVYVILVRNVSGLVVRRSVLIR